MVLVAGPVPISIQAPQHAVEATPSQVVVAVKDFAAAALLPVLASAAQCAAVLDAGQSSRWLSSGGPYQVVLGDFHWTIVLELFSPSNPICRAVPDQVVLGDFHWTTAPRLSSPSNPICRVVPCQVVVADFHWSNAPPRWSPSIPTCRDVPWQAVRQPVGRVVHRFQRHYFSDVPVPILESN